jgi:putative FmdB family regulatory protein
MPTYEYECSKCNLVFEHFQSMNDEPLKTCIHPEGCVHKRAKAKVQRLIGTGAGIIFKGSGFYETDYRSSEYKEKAKKDSEPASTSSSTESSSKKEDTAKKKDKPAKASANGSAKKD